MTTISPESKQVLEAQAIKAKFDELTALSRLVVNTLNLVCSNDITIPSAFAQPVAEIQNWLQGMHKNIQSQLDTLKALVPAEDKKPEVVEAEVLQVSK